MSEFGESPPPLRKDGLQLDESPEFQERFWAVERVAWAGYALVVALALAGLTGAGGPLAKGEATSGEVAVDYPRVTRVSLAETLTVRFPAEGPTRRLTLAEPFPERFDIETIRPEPERSYVGAEGLTYEFAVEGAAAAPVRLTVRAQTAGRARYRILLNDADPLELTTFVLP